MTARARAWTADGPRRTCRSSVRAFPLCRAGGLDPGPVRRHGRPLRGPDRAAGREQAPVLRRARRAHGRPGGSHPSSSGQSGGAGRHRAAQRHPGHRRHARDARLRPRLLAVRSRTPHRAQRRDAGSLGLRRGRGRRPSAGALPRCAGRTHSGGGLRGGLGRTGAPAGRPHRPRRYRLHPVHLRLDRDRKGRGPQPPQLPPRQPDHRQQRAHQLRGPHRHLLRRRGRLDPAHLRRAAERGLRRHPAGGRGRRGGLVEAIRERGLTLLHSVPPVFRRVVEAVPEGEKRSSVRSVRLAGDRCDWRDYDAFRRICGEHAVFGVNLGSTEVNSTYAHWWVDETSREPGSRLPVGREMDDMEVSIVGEDGQPVPDGDVGELVVKSRAISRWATAAAELTAEVFSRPIRKTRLPHLPDPRHGFPPPRRAARVRRPQGPDDQAAGPSDRTGGDRGGAAWMHGRAGRGDGDPPRRSRRGPRHGRLRRAVSGRPGPAAPTPHGHAVARASQVPAAFGDLHREVAAPARQLQAGPGRHRAPGRRARRKGCQPRGRSRARRGGQGLRGGGAHLPGDGG